MISDDEARQLHERATRGMELSRAEEAALAAWYSRQDADESAIFAAALPSPALDQLRAEISETVARLRVATQQIEAQVKENERLRQENASLQRRLSAAGAAPRA